MATSRKPKGGGGVRSKRSRSVGRSSASRGRGRRQGNYEAFVRGRMAADSMSDLPAHLRPSAQQAMSAGYRRATRSSGSRRRAAAKGMRSQGGPSRRGGRRR